MPRTIGPSIKRRKWAKLTAQLGNATEAAARVYNVKNRKIANAIGPYLLQVPETKDLLEKELLLAGATRDRIAGTLNEALDAKNPIVYEGKVHEEYPAHETRIKAARTIAELLDLFPDKQKIKKSLHLEVHGHYSEEELKRLLGEGV